MKKLYFTTIAIVLISFFNLNAQSLLAKYPLITDGIDITGNNTEMSISKAPFQNGGIYSNGIYSGDDTTGSYIQSPQIVDFDFDNLTIITEFLIEEHPEINEPIILIGSGWRWLSAWIEGNKIALKVNDGSFYEVSEVVINLNQWYTVAISYNKSEGKAKLHLDNELIITIEVEEITHGNDAFIVNSDGGIGKAYKGYWKNLEIHNSSTLGIADNNRMENITVKTLGDQIQIDVPFENTGTSLQMFDISGRKIGEYKLVQGTNSFAVPKGNNIIMIVLNDQKGNRLARKLYCNN